MRTRFVFKENLLQYKGAILISPWSSKSKSRLQVSCVRRRNCFEHQTQSKQGQRKRCPVFSSPSCQCKANTLGIPLIYTQHLYLKSNCLMLILCSFVLLTNILFSRRFCTWILTDYERIFSSTTSLFSGFLFKVSK